MSGGEEQRVAIARAVAKRPDVLLCDEPTGALDAETGRLVLKTLLDVNGTLGTTTAIITHNAAIAAMGDRVLTIVIGSACLIAMGVVYNATRIALSERGRELASLRVLGFTKREVSGILLGEQGVTTVLALPLGVLFGLIFSALLARAMVNDRIHFPFVANPASYLFAAIVVVVSAVLAGLIVRQRIDRLDLVAVLTTRE